MKPSIQITHSDNFLDFQMPWKIAAFLNKQISCFSLSPEHSLISEPSPSQVPTRKQLQEKPANKELGNCACNSLSNCQEFSSSARSCSKSEMIPHIKDKTSQMRSHRFR